MGFHNSRASAYIRSVQAHARAKEREEIRLEEENSKLARFIIGEILRCLKPQYIDKRKANKYIKLK